MEKSIINLWVDSCVRPRELIQEIVDYDPKYLMWTNIFVGVAISAIMLVTSAGSLANYGSLITLLLGLLGFLAFFYIFSWLWSWSGKLLGGNANVQVIRATMAWSIPASLVYNVVEHLYLTIASGQITYAPMIISVIGSIWVMSISIRFLSQVQGFSIGRAMANYFLPILPFLILGILAAIIIPILSRV